MDYGVLEVVQAPVTMDPGQQPVAKAAAKEAPVGFSDILARLTATKAEAPDQGQDVTAKLAQMLEQLAAAEDGQVSQGLWDKLVQVIARTGAEGQPQVKSDADETQQPEGIPEIPALLSAMPPMPSAPAQVVPADVAKASEVTGQDEGSQSVARQPLSSERSVQPTRLVPQVPTTPSSETVAKVQTDAKGSEQAQASDSPTGVAGAVEPKVVKEGRSSEAGLPESGGKSGATPMVEKRADPATVVIRAEARPVPDPSGPSGSNEVKSGQSQSETSGGGRSDSAIEPLLTSVSAGQRPQLNVEPKVESQGSVQTDGARLADRIVQAARMSVERGQNTVEMRLNSPELGTLKLSMSLDRGQVTLSMETATETARQLIHSQLAVLREGLTQQGLQVVRLHVYAQEHGSATGGWSHTQEQGGQNPRRQRAEYATFDDGVEAAHAPAVMARLGSQRLDLVA